MSKLSNTNNPRTSGVGILHKKIDLKHCFCMSYVLVKDIKDIFGSYSAGDHLLPFRTEKLSPATPMILQQVCGKVGHCQVA